LTTRTSSLGVAVPGGFGEGAGGEAVAFSENLKPRGTAAVVLRDEVADARDGTGDVRVPGVPHAATQQRIITVLGAGQGHQRQ
jgi:hypothetical protein